MDLEPTPRARVESGTFVRGSGQRLSWRLVPSVTQQVREAIAAEAAKADVSEGGESSSHHRHQAEVMEEGTGEISFQSEEDATAEDSESGEGQKPARNVVLVAQDEEEEEGPATSEPVTMTFTIGSRGNQDTANGDLVTSSAVAEGRGQSTLEQDTVRDTFEISQNITFSSDQIKL